MVSALSLCSGAGGFDLAVHRLRLRHVGFVEFDDYCRSVLARHWPGVPQWPNLTALDPVSLPACDLVTAGFPCQPSSHAGKRAGRADDRWLWPHVLRVVVALRPAVVVLENVPGLVTVDGGQAFHGILRDLWRAGYGSEWEHCAAAHFGAPHIRDRVFVVARLEGRTWQRDEVRVGVQGTLFVPGRIQWPRAGRWDGTLWERASQWPMQRGRWAWEGAVLPTPRVSANRSSRRSMVDEQHWSAPALEQAVELASGVLPREFRTEEELTPQSREWIGMLPTPRACDADKGGHPRQGQRGDLQAFMRGMLPTPSVSEADRGHGYQRAGGRIYPTLTGAVGAAPAGPMLPTPNARDGKGKPGEGCRERGGHEWSLPVAVGELLPTPAARDYRSGKASDEVYNANARPLSEVVHRRAGQPAKGTLNPAFVEWMMGWPSDWTLPTGPSLADAPSLSWQPDAAPEALTTQRRLRRKRLKALGNGVVAAQGEWVLRSVVESLGWERAG